jgi:hypothetical protein
VEVNLSGTVDPVIESVLLCGCTPPLERQLTEIAIRLPAGEPSRTLFAHLQELKKVLKLNLGIHVRAEALVSAAN